METQPFLAKPLILSSKYKKITIVLTSGIVTSFMLNYLKLWAIFLLNVILPNKLINQKSEKCYCKAYIFIFKVNTQHNTFFNPCFQIVKCIE